MRNKLKLALRVLARRKVFTAISLTGIALTLVVLTLATAVIDNIVAPQQPQSRLDRMLFIYSVRLAGPSTTRTSNPGFGFVERTLRGLPGAERVAVFSEAQQAAVYAGADRINTQWRRVDAEYWRVHDFAFVEGQPFGESERQGNRRVAVITSALSNSLFRGAPAVGHELNLGGNLYRIVGVVPHVPVSRISAYADVWTPLPLPTSEQRQELFGDLSAIVLAKTPRDFDPIRAEFQQRVRRYQIPDPKTFTVITAALDTNFSTLARTVTGNQFGDRSALVVGAVMAAVALLFMTLPALNLVTLNLSRILERAPEIGVRKAFGAPRSRLVGQFVLENVVLTLVGGAIAFVLAFTALRMFDASGALPDAHFELNVRVFAAAMAIAALFGVLSGAYPAWKMSRLHPVDALRGGAQ